MTVGKVMQREILTEGVNQRLAQSFDDPLDIRPDNGRMPSFTEVMQRAGRVGDHLAPTDGQSFNQPDLETPWHVPYAKFMVSRKSEDAAEALQLIRGRKTELHREMESVQDEITRLDQSLNLRKHFEGWIKWIESYESFRLEAPHQSVWHKVRTAFDAGHIIHGGTDANGQLARVGAEFDPFFVTEPQVFLIEHDWSAAFAKATDFEDGEFPLPFANCAFEFTLSGRRILLLAAEGRIALVSDIGEGFWFCSAWTTLEDLGNSTRYRMVAQNVRALCIAMDAEIVVSQVVRAPHRLNLAREKQGKKPINDYHIINLAKRSRVTPLPSEGEHEARWHPRLHFRRGHWRHYDNHKTWIKWMLVGDPDLGFIDKEYRA